MSDPKPLKDVPVLVTGATGFIGARAAGLLLEAGAMVSALARTPGRLAPGIRGIRGVLAPGADLGAACQGQSAIVNFAHDFKAGEEANLAAFDALLDAAEAAGIGCLIHASSIVVYDMWPDGDLDEASAITPGGNPYRAAKIAMEMRLEAFSARTGIPSIILQPTIVYGAGGWLWTDGPVERLLAGPVVLPDPPGTAHAVHVDDVAEAVVRGLARVMEAGTGPDGDARKGQCHRVILNGPDAPSWADVYQGYATAIGRGRIGLEDPGDLARALPPPPSPGDTPAPGPGLVEIAGAFARRLLGRGPVDRARQLVGRLRRLRGPVAQYPDAYALALYQTRGTCRSTRAPDALGWAPEIGWEEGLRRTTPYLHRTYGGPADPGGTAS